MGDMREYFDSMKDAKNRAKQKRLEEADNTGWTTHTAYHWSRKVKHGDVVKRIDYWPSTGQCMVSGKRSNIKSNFIQKMINSDS